MGVEGRGLVGWLVDWWIHRGLLSREERKREWEGEEQKRKRRKKNGVDSPIPFTQQQQQTVEEARVFSMMIE